MRPPLTISAINRHPQFATVQHSILRPFSRQCLTAVKNQRHAFPAFIHHAHALRIAILILRHNTPSQKARKNFITGGLAVRQTVRRHRVDEHPRGINFQSIIKQPNTHFGSRHGVITMHHRINHSFKNRRHYQTAVDLPARRRRVLQQKPAYCDAQNHMRPESARPTAP